MRRLPVLLLAAGSLTACGGSAKLYTAATTRTCLAAHGAKIAPVTNDLVASTATGGAFQAHIAGNSATFAFGATATEADKINDAYHRFAGKNVGLDDVLFQQRNAVMLWRRKPPPDARGVTDCLK